jgi:hypothetical protein
MAARNRSSGTVVRRDLSVMCQALRSLVISSAFTRKPIRTRIVGQLCPELGCPMGDRRAYSTIAGLRTVEGGIAP